MLCGAAGALLRLVLVAVLTKLRAKGQVGTVRVL